MNTVQEWKTAIAVAIQLEQVASEILNEIRTDCRYNVLQSGTEALVLDFSLDVAPCKTCLFRRSLGRRWETLQTTTFRFLLLLVITIKHREIQARNIIPNYYFFIRDQT